MDELQIFDALRQYVGALLDGAQLSGTVSVGGTQPAYTPAGEQSNRSAVNHVQSYAVMIVPHASLPPEDINEARNREAERVREAVEHDPSLGGRLARPQDFIRAERTVSVGEVEVVYLTDTAEPADLDTLAGR